MKIFISASDGSLRSFDGMSEETVITLLADLGITGTIITEESYNNLLEQLL